MSFLEDLLRKLGRVCVALSVAWLCRAPTAAQFAVLFVYCGQVSALCVSKFTVI